MRLNPTILLLLAVLCLISCVGCMSLVSDRPLLRNSNSINAALLSTVAIIHIAPTDPPQEFPACSGVFITPTRVLTAAHCVRRRLMLPVNGQDMAFDIIQSPVGDVVKIRTWSDYTHNLTVNRDFVVLGFDANRDLALLELRNGEDTNFYHMSMPISDGEESIGQDMYTVGHPAQLWFYLTDGIVARNRSRASNGAVSMHVTTQIYRGNSGGPVFDDAGRLHGIVSQFYGEQAHLNRSIHVISIREFLQNVDRGVVYQDIPVPEQATSSESLQSH